MFSQLIPIHRTYEGTFSLNIWRLWRKKHVTYCGDKKFQLVECNTVIIFQRAIIIAACDAFGCTYSCKNSPGLRFQGISVGNFQNKWFRQIQIQNIHRAVPLPKEENFLSVQIILEEIVSTATLRWRILYLFPSSDNS